VFVFAGYTNTAELGRVSAHDDTKAQAQALELARAWFADRAKDAASL
jgi:hypothetical protein